MPTTPPAPRPRPQPAAPAVQPVQQATPPIPEPGRRDEPRGAIVVNPGTPDEAWITPDRAAPDEDAGLSAAARRMARIERDLTALAARVAALESAGGGA